MTRSRRRFPQETGHPTISADPQTIYVSIFCEGRTDNFGQKMHADRIWRLGTFNAKPGDELDWTESVSGYQSPSSAFLLSKGKPMTKFLQGNKYFEGETAHEHAQEIDRIDYDLQCGYCTLRKSTQKDKLHPVLSALLLNGVREVSLSLLISKMDRGVSKSR